MLARLGWRMSLLNAIAGQPTSSQAQNDMSLCRVPSYPIVDALCPPVPISESVFDKFVMWRTVVQNSDISSREKGRRAQASTQVMLSTKRDAGDGIIKRSEGITHTTICLRPSRGLRMNLRVRRVTGESLSAIFADCRDGLWGLVDGGETGR